MKFVLIFAFLASANFCLGNTTGPDQNVCATPCNPININVNGKEGIKGEKGEKGDSGTSCKCNLQDSNKPSAHIEAADKKLMTYQPNSVIKDWSVSAPHSHLAGGMKYKDGKLTVPTPGRYYIYAQLFYLARRRVYICVNGNPITMIQPPVSGTDPEDRGSLYTGGVFILKAGDVITLDVGSWHTAISAKIHMSTFHSYFGAFLI
ncbi:hypothetical protein ACROYT_G039457 [Oculina patagonica]